MAAAGRSLTVATGARRRPRGGFGGPVIVAGPALDRVLGTITPKEHPCRADI